MRLVTALLIVLFSATTFAMPSVNDEATYDMTISMLGQNMKGTSNVKLVAYDAATKQFTQVTTITMEGQAPQTQNVQIQADKLPSDESVNDVVSTCQTKGGTVEKVTVPAGTFNTCKMAAQDPQFGAGTSNIGNVPFGMVQSTFGAAGMADINMKLNAFKLGN
jgi:hypothetical protein